MAARVITAGGCLGILIPPSVMLVLLGPVLGVSVVKLFAAAIIPGLILSGLYIGYTIIRCQLNPELGPPLPLEERAASLWVKMRELLAGIVPLGVIVFAALGSIIFGLATPTEAAAMAAYYLKGVAPDWHLTKIYRGMMEFMILQVIGLLIVLLFPQVALWLPELLFG